MGSESGWESVHLGPEMASPDKPVRDKVGDLLLEINRKLEELQRARDELASEQSTGGSPKHTGSDTALDRVVRFLVSAGNQPQTTTAIREATGLSRGALATLLYSDQKGRFVSADMPEHARMKVWSLRDPGPPTQDLKDKTSVEVCRQILLENGNQPLHILTLAKIALRRGYRGRAKTTGDALEFTTATGFWARLARDYKHAFEQVRDKTFRLRDPNKPIDKLPMGNLFDDSEDES